MQYFSLIGQVSVTWNTLERDMDRLLFYYLQEEEDVFGRLMAAIGNKSKGDLLKFLANKRESNEKLREAITKFVTAFNILRENRNTIQHATPILEDNGIYTERVWKMNSLGVIKQYEITLGRLEHLRDEIALVKGLSRLLVAALKADEQDERDEAANAMHSLLTSPKIFVQPRKIDPIENQ